MKYTVIPEPLYFNIKNTQSVFALSDFISFEGSPETESSLSDLLGFLKDVFSLEPIGDGKEKIRLEISGKGESEGYSIRTEQSRVILTGNDEKGLFYAVQTLKQLLFCGKGTLPELEINDKPRFASRGFMLDCGRYFFTVEAVKQFIDMMALHKLNEFHWHLSEDQGFRCQLESKLLLTEIGSRRSHTNFNTKPHEGYYTKAQLKDVIEYAHSKHIKVIPEIDSPGHVMAMLAAYPELACFPQEYTVSTFWGVKHDVLCIGKENTFLFMQELYDELTEIFTDGIIHLGGDEVPTLRWKLCPDCRKRMEQEGMKDESELHTYYLNRIAEYLRNKGLEVRMWNDCIREKMTDRSIAWELWNSEMNENEIVSELNSGRKFLLACEKHFYLDFPYALTSLEKSYSFDAVYNGLTEEGKNNILGVEGCLWAEFVPDMLKADRYTYPRLAAICETAWSLPEKKNFSAFTDKLENYYGLLKAFGINVMPLKSTAPTGIKQLAGKLWWERRKLCWGAHHNMLSDYKVKNILKNQENKG